MYWQSWTKNQIHSFFCNTILPILKPKCNTIVQPGLFVYGHELPTSNCMGSRLNCSWIIPMLRWEVKVNIKNFDGKKELLHSLEATMRS